METVIRALVRSYWKLPYKPLKGPLMKIFRAYSSLNKNRIVTAAIDGITYELDLNEGIDSEIYYTGCYKTHTSKAIGKICKEGFTVLDVGANMGAYTFRFAKSAGPKGKVIAFEPMSWAFAKLTRNLELNDFSNVTLERLALSDRSKGNQEIHAVCSWPINDIGDSKRPAGLRGKMMKDVVDVATLDDYVARKGIERIDLIKLDVDGHELRVLLGASETLKAHSPIILMELAAYTLEEAGDSVVDLVSLLHKHGYRFYSTKGMKEYPDADGMIDSIPARDAIDVIASKAGL
jgi:FkbM family methyltransferase